MSKIKVLQINKLYYPCIGGVEQVLQQTAESLKDIVEMQVLVCQPQGHSVVENINGVMVERCSSFGVFYSMPISFVFLWRLRKRAKGKDILQLHAPFPLGDLALLLSGYRGKVVVYWHSDVVKQKKLMILYRPIMKRFLKRADAIVVGADGVAKGSSYLQDYLDKCVVIPFAVNPNIEEQGKRYLDQREPRFDYYAKFLFVGRLVYYKGVEILLQALRSVQNAELTIVGCGELEDSLKSFAKEQGISERVHFLGKVDEEEIYHVFSACDVFVLPSIAKSEAFGLVQLEAMAYGKPVINTNLPSGVPEVSVDGITGLTVEPGDIEALSSAMQWMVDHPKERNEMGMAARARIENNYKTDVMTSKILDLYETLMKSGGEKK